MYCILDLLTVVTPLFNMGMCYIFTVFLVIPRVCKLLKKGETHKLDSLLCCFRKKKKTDKNIYNMVQPKSNIMVYHPKIY